VPEAIGFDSLMTNSTALMQIGNSQPEFITALRNRVCHSVIGGPGPMSGLGLSSKTLMSALGH
jgi:hypothetical protein